jgi:hypothetical protein
MQEEFYEEVQKRYKDLIELKNSTGTNALESSKKDIKAKTLEKTEVFAVSGSTGDSPFEAPAYVEKVTARKLGKPYKVEDIENHIKDALGDKDPWEFKRDILRNVETSYEAYIERKIKADPDFDRAGLDRHFESFTEDFRKLPGIGQSFWLRLGKGDEIPAVLVDIRAEKTKHGNPATKSNIKLVFDVASAQKRIIVPMTKFYSDEMGGRYIHESERKELYEGEEITSATETRYIVTGNLLAGFDAVHGMGEIVNFTRHDGTTEKGILMPFYWTMDGASVTKRLSTVDEAVKALHDGSTIVGDAGRLRIGKPKAQGYAKDVLQYVIRIPNTKQDSAKYTKDATLHNIINGRPRDHVITPEERSMQRQFSAPGKSQAFMTVQIGDTPTAHSSVILERVLEYFMEIGIGFKQMVLDQRTGIVAPGFSTSGRQGRMPTSL